MISDLFSQHRNFFNDCDIWLQPPLQQNKYFHPQPFGFTNVINVPQTYKYYKFEIEKCVLGCFQLHEANIPPKLAFKEWEGEKKLLAHIPEESEMMHNSSFR